MTQPSFRAARWIGAALLIFALSGCGGGTKFTATWTNPEYAEKQNVDDVVVVGISQSDANRRMFEQEMAARLEKQGVTAWPSVTFHPDPGQLSEEQIRTIIEDNGIEAILVTRLVDVDRKDVYVPPTTYVSSYPAYGGAYYGSWYGYYSYGYTVTHDPGYTYEKVTVTLETNLYDAATEELIWSGQSNTFDPAGVQDVIGPTTQLIVEELVARKLLHPKK